MPFERLKTFEGHFNYKPFEGQRPLEGYYLSLIGIYSESCNRTIHFFNKTL